MRILITAGPTHEPIDPVRVLTNRSSGNQGYAIAEALALRGARVTLVSGPVALPAPRVVKRIWIETAQQMLDACRAALPADAAVCVAAVSDWRPDGIFGVKLKKGKDGPPNLVLVENPDILADLSAPGPTRPRLVVGFAAETDDLEANAKGKLRRKGCDWIVGNDVSADDIMGGDDNRVILLQGDLLEVWPKASKADVAACLVEKIVQALT